MKVIVEVVEVLLNQSPALLDRVQHFLTKSVLKPSGPDDLLDGRFATTASISQL
jgi:hypothetical protein